MSGLVWHDPVYDDKKDPGGWCQKSFGRLGGQYFLAVLKGIFIACAGRPDIGSAHRMVWNAAMVIGVCVQHRDAMVDVCRRRGVSDVDGVDDNQLPVDENGGDESGEVA